ncbi:hypothetical protein SDC9_26430 [bioreactor metagenome]|uniref:Uncharacterized protein n=1 Tax=bioreactor metagenome TaxID=1076179 RepID=A0A644UNM5_9ZZZZ
MSLGTGRRHDGIGAHPGKPEKHSRNPPKKEEEIPLKNYNNNVVIIVY